MGGMKPIDNKPIPAVNRPGVQAEKPKVQPGKSFKEVLEAVKEQHGISLSTHAQVRMTARNIMLDKGQVQRLSMAVERARQKGVRDTLVLMDDTAFVVNVKSTTVVTATKRDSLKDKVFTNIDGAVIL